MKKYFIRPTMKDSLFLALMFLLGGLALCFFKRGLLVTIVRLYGIVLAVYGAYQLYSYFGLHRTVNSAPMIMGIPSLIFGLILALFPGSIINFFPIIAGIILIFNAVTQIQSALVLKSSGASSWVISMVIAIAMLVFGLLLVMRPSSLINMIMTITGCGLIVEAFVILFDALTTRNVR